MSDVADITIAGDVHGQVAAGEFVYQAQSIGGVINQYAIEGEVIVARPSPLYERPPHRDAFVGRADETDEILAELAHGPVQLFGEDGLGKTWLVGELAHHPEAHHRRDGIAYVDARRRPLEDVLQALFDVFYDSRLPQIALKATPTQIRQAMADREAFVIVDHLEVARDDVGFLVQALPGCTVVLAGEEESLYGDGGTIRLGGLDAAASVALFSGELRRDLEPDEEAEVQWYCSAVGGHPLTIVRTARRLRRGEIDVAGLRGLAAGSEVRGGVVEALAQGVDREDQVILSPLAAVAPEALPPEAVTVLAGGREAGTTLDDLDDRGVVRTGSPRYRLPLDVAATLGLGDWRSHVLVTLPVWVRGADPQLVADASGAIEAISTWGLGAGRSADVGTLARAVAPALATTRQWGSLRTVLGHAQRAAESAGDRQTEAWALHELGTLDACSDELTRGRDRLTRAETIRREVGTAAELEVTRHNLEQLRLALAGPPEPAPDGWPRWLKLLIGTVLAAVVAVVVVAVVASSTGEDGDGDGGPDDGGPAGAGFVEIDESPIDFGTVELGQGSARQRSVTNAGDATLELQAIELTVGDQFDVGNDCSAPLQPGGSCTIEVVFVASEPGEWADRLVIVSDAENREASIDVFGAVDEGRVEPTPDQPTPEPPTPEPPTPVPPEIVVEPDELDFGRLLTGEQARAEIVVANVGEQPLELFERSIAGGRAFELDDRCPDALGPGEECSLVVLVPGLGGGFFEDVLIIGHSAPQPQVEVPLTVVAVIG